MPAKLVPAYHGTGSIPPGRIRKSRAHLAMIAATGAMALSAGFAGAADVDYQGVAAGGAVVWNTTTSNWNDVNQNSVVWNNANGDGATFQYGNSGNINVTTNVATSSMDFTTNGYTLGGAGTVTLVNGNSSLQNITYGSGYLPYNPTTGAAITLTGLIEVTASLTTTINTAEIDNNLVSTVGLEKVGNGTLILGGTNNITGNYALQSGLTADVVIGGFTPFNASVSNPPQGGILRLASATALQPTARVDIGAGYLDIGSNNTTIGSLTFTSQGFNQYNAAGMSGQSAAALSLTNGVTGSGTLNVTGAITALPYVGVQFGGAYTDGISSNINMGGGTQSIQSAYGTNFGLVFTGSLMNGSVALTGIAGVATTGASFLGNNTYTGSTLFYGGTETIAGTNQTASLKQYGGSTTVLGANGSLAGTTAISLLAGGTLILDNLNNNYNSLNFTATGPVVSQQAYYPYVPGADNTGRTNSTAAVTMRDGQLQLRSQLNGSSSAVIGSLSTTAGSNTIVVAPANSLSNSSYGAAATLTIAGNLSVNAQSTLNINTPGFRTDLLGGAAKVFVNGTLPTADATGVIPNVFDASGFLTYNATTGLTPYTAYASTFATAGANVLVSSNSTVSSSVSINALNLGGTPTGVNISGLGATSNGSVGNIYTVTIATGTTLTVASGMVVDTFNNYNTNGTSYAYSTVNVSGGTLNFGAKQGVVFGSTPNYWTSNTSTGTGTTNAFSVINLANYTNIYSAVTGSGGLLASGGTASGAYISLDGDLSGLTGPITVASNSLIINPATAAGNFTGNYYVHTGVLSFQTNQSSSTPTIYLGDSSADTNLVGKTATLDLGSIAYKTFNNSGGGGGLGNTNAAAAPAIFAPTIIVDNGLRTLNGVALNPTQYSYFCALDLLYDSTASQTVSSNIQLNTPLVAIAGSATASTFSTTFTGTLSGSSLMYLKAGRYNYGTGSVISNTGGLAIGLSGNTAQVQFAGTANTSEPFYLYGGNRTYMSYTGQSSITSGPLNLAGSTGGGVSYFSIIPAVTGTTLSNQININADLTFNASAGITTTWAGQMTGSSNLFTVNAGTLVLSGTGNTFTGNLNIGGGAIVTNAANLSPASVFVGPSGTLASSGTITWPLTLQGTLYPGLLAPTTATSLTIPATSNLSGGTLKLDLTGPGMSDQIIFAGGSPTLTGAYVALVNSSAGTFTSGETFQLFNFSAGAPVGTFVSPLSAYLPALPAGLDWNAATLYSAGTISIGSTANGIWNNSGSGSWEDGTQWLSGTVPGGSGTTVVFGDVIGTGSATVTLAAETVGTVNFNGNMGGSYTLAGTQLGLFNATAPAVIATTSGIQTITAPVGYAGNLNLNTAGGSSLVLAGGLSSGGTGTITINGTGTNISGGATIPGSLNVSAGSSLLLSGSGITLSKFNLLASTSTLNIGSTGVVYTNTPITLAAGTLNDYGNFSTGSVTTAQNLATYINLSSGSILNINPGGLLVTFASFNLPSGAAINVYGNLAGAQSKTLTVGAGATLNVSSGALLGLPKTVTYNTNSSGNVLSIGGTANFLGATSGTAPVVNYLQGLKLAAGGKVNFLASDSLADRSFVLCGFGGSTLSATAGLVDLGSNDLGFISTYTSTSGVTSLTSFIKAGYNGGAWNGTTGITSSAAANDPMHIHAFGVIVNDTTANFNGVSGAILYSNFDGYTNTVFNYGNSISKTTDLIKYTYYGDANLDGMVDGSDYSLVDANYALAAASRHTGWYNGDFNYDGVLNGSDYTLMDNAFNQQGAQISAQIATATALVAGGSSAVPEPTSLTLIGLATAGLLSRRRRQN